MRAAATSGHTLASIATAASASPDSAKPVALSIDCEALGEGRAREEGGYECFVDVKDNRDLRTKARRRGNGVQPDVRCSLIARNAWLRCHAHVLACAGLLLCARARVRGRVIPFPRRAAVV
jgi:hypothetical protein